MKEIKTHRNTKQREVILEALQGVKSHPTADELYNIVKTQLPKISLGTVYRNLEYLAHSGIIRTLEMGNQKRFDADISNHYHVRCTKCGKVSDVFIKPFDIIKDAQEESDYKVTGFNLEYYGQCSKCET